MLEQLHSATKYILLILFFSLFSIVSIAQVGNNPFEIKSQRQIEEETRQVLKGEDSDNNDEDKENGSENKVPINPFEIIAPITTSPNITEKVIAPIIPTVTTQTQSLQEKGQNFLFSIVLFVLVLLTVLVTVSRNLIGRIYQSFFNDVVLKSLYREQRPISTTIYTALYVMYLVNLSIFIFLGLYNFNKIFNNSEFFTLLYCMAAVSILFIGKHFLIRMLSNIFSLKKELGLYAFVVVVFGILIGLILAPTNVLLAYAEPEIAQKIVIVGSIVIVLIYLFRALRSLTLVQSYIFSNFFHFLLYLCAVEIAPVLLLLKIINDKIQLSIF
jgi:hypothetical protein